TAPNAFRMPFLVEPADAAERIVRGLERGTKEIHFPAPLSWTMKVLRVVPYGLYERFMKRAGAREGRWLMPTVGGSGSGRRKHHPPSAISHQPSAISGITQFPPQARTAS